MSATLEVTIEGIGLCAPGLPNWPLGSEVLRGAVDIAAAPSAPRPQVELLSPNEQRRAPQSVLLALATAEEACRAAARSAHDLPNVFASAYGDLAINDYLCTVLARAPLELSPTRFHNSVHNAAAGYWSIATGCMASTTAIGAGASTFAAGLLEAAAIVCSEATPVLCVVTDIAAVGPLAGVIDCDIPFSAAFVLAPRAATAAPCLRLQACARAAQPASLPAPLQALRERNPAAASLPLLVALARRENAAFDFALHDDQDLPTSTLHLEISF